MSLVRLIEVTKRFEQRIVLRQASLRIEPGQRLGIIGKNGVGKTTLLKLILGQEHPDEGTLETAPDLRVGYFSQFSELLGEQTTMDVLESIFAPIHRLERELTEVEAAITATADDKALHRLLLRQSELLDEMERQGAWTYRNQIETVLSKLRFTPDMARRPVAQLSGGWRNRAALAKLLLEPPDLLLLDEPTNFLDIQGVAWLEEWLRKLRGGVVVITHDREFLDHVVDRIVEIENHQFQVYPGDYAAYVREKRSRSKQLRNQFEHEEELLAIEAEGIADRKETAANPSDALKRRLANVKKRVEPRPTDMIVTALYANFQAPTVLCAVKDLAKAYAGQPLFTDLSLTLSRGDRLGIVGPNGTGKTTLLRVLTGEEPADAGKITWRAEPAFCYYNAVLEGLDLADTVTHAVNVVKLANKAPRKAVNRFLGLMQFSEMDLQQRIGSLSGGQRARVALAQCLLSGAGTIVLDEPTNHLDITSIQVMERALVNFPGAVVVVSHDRFFLDQVATRLLVFSRSGRMELMEGNWSLCQPRFPAENT